ncbi:hypothetical protein EMIT0194MI4_10881 [Pseudomonas sp. IT-194MI4]
MSSYGGSRAGKDHSTPCGTVTPSGVENVRTYAQCSFHAGNTP